MEAQLIARARKGDSRAYEQLYRTHVGRVYALCSRLCGDVHWAEDLTQEAFVRAWQKLNQFDGNSQFSTWLYRLTSNWVISQLRRSKRKFEVTLEAVEEQGSSAPAGLVDDLDKAIRKLPDGPRAVLVLHSVEGYSHEEIADLLDIAVGTSKVQLHRARKQLQQWLTPPEAASA